VFVPVFFVRRGLRFDLHALFASPSTVARVPLQPANNVEATAPTAADLTVGSLLRKPRL